MNQTFTYTFPNGDSITWNASLARKLVAAGRFTQLSEIPRDQMAVIAERNDWDADRLNAVDPSEPGIGAPIIVTRDEMPELGPEPKHIIYVLIDGTHRCVRALRDGLPFHAHLLTDDAALECLITASPAWRVATPNQERNIACP